MPTLAAATDEVTFVRRVPSAEELAAAKQLRETANDYIGYCPTDKALGEGSYETRLARTSKAAAGTEGSFVSASVRLLEQLAGK